MWFRLCLAMGEIHPRHLQPKLTRSDFLDWLEYWNQEPWGEFRNDLRQEVFRVRLTSGMFGANGNTVPNAVWPYYDSEEDLEEVIEGCEAFEDAIEPDGKGGYKWREQPLQS